ncbi:IS5 family transposase [uncultured Roseibium sp.]|uniref:IS5 family transposase n=1 Tax=uncultured Roseibium sp. TaxID=1936171 RepID=UPI00262B270F|nr:IS5 family transposase [uncultured Roseibium sp.]
MTNWTEYNESLRRRADITVWFDESVEHQWGVGPTGKRGRPCRYSDFAITVTLQIRTVFHLALRQVQGFVRSLFKLMQLELAVPDFSTLSRRTSRLAPLPREGSKAFGPLDLVVDSTGLKVFGTGDWQETKHGKTQQRRSWRKLHLGLDLETGQIACSELTTDDIGDPSAVPGLLDQIDEPVHRFLADGAYDGAATRTEIMRRFAYVEIIIPPPKTAVAGPEAETAPTARDLDVLAIKAHGRMAWQKSSGYNKRARVETLMGRWKSVIGERLRSRTLDNQRTESRIGVSVLNKMTSLARPTFERIS